MVRLYYCTTPIVGCNWIFPTRVSLILLLVVIVTVALGSDAYSHYKKKVIGHFAQAVRSGSTKVTAIKTGHSCRASGHSSTVPIRHLA